LCHGENFFPIYDKLLRMSELSSEVQKLSLDQPQNPL
jgi:hypothetical protein